MCVADVITTRLMLLPMTFCILADVIAIIVVDVITTVLNVLADGICHTHMAITSAIFNIIKTSGNNICHN